MDELQDKTTSQKTWQQNNRHVHPQTHSIHRAEKQKSLTTFITSPTLLPEQTPEIQTDADTILFIVL